MKTAKNMRCMIRMDDITPTMNWERFNQVRRIFEKYHICPLVGVVPECRDPKLNVEEPRDDFWELLKELQTQGWMIAQHGTYHQYVTGDSGLLGLKQSSEFAGLSYEEQYEKLKVGKQILDEHGIDTDIFMAPGHTYDRNTVKALAHLGFKVITDGLYYRPYRYEGMVFVPCRLKSYKNTKGIDTICLHSNGMTDKDMDELEAFCKVNLQNIVSFSKENTHKQLAKRGLCVIVYEKIELKLRQLKNAVANSDRLKWYMSYTNDRNSKKKWMKRIICIPRLIIGSGKESKS